MLEFEFDREEKSFRKETKEKVVGTKWKKSRKAISPNN